MRPKASRKTQEQPLIGWRLDMVLDADQELYRLASAIDWSALGRIGNSKAPFGLEPGSKLTSRG